MTDADIQEPAPFLASSPPPWAARALATVLLLLFAAGMAAIVLIQVPETVSAPFVVAPHRASDPVRALHPGSIGRIEVQDAQAVKQGQVLFVLVSEPVGDRSAERENLDVRLQGKSGRLANEQQKHANKQHADEQEQRRLTDRLENLERLAALKTEQLALAREIAAKMQQGLDSGVSSWMDASKPQLDVQRLEVELQQVRVDRADAQGLLSRLQFDMASDTASFKETQRAIGEEARGFEARRSALEADPALRDGSTITVMSPCDGTVVKLHVNAAATVVDEGDTLAEIVCAGEQLQAELELPERGLALARPGQTVKLMYDAFPYQRYGVRFGTLRWVSPASSAGRPGPSFRALADLDGETVGVQGQRRPILPGMTGRAVVIVGRRSLASYAIEPLRQLRESLVAERPPVAAP